LGESQRDRATLVANGWKVQGIAFYAAVTEPVAAPAPAPQPQPQPQPAPGSGGTDTEFTFAAYPDTQRECWRSSDTRFIDRSKWLVQNKAALDLRFATHSGDVVDWDTPKHEQYELASAAMRPLESAGIPYTLAIGNHDTAAVGVGGSAATPGQTHIQVRDTRTFNAYFNASRYTNVRGAYESGKVDNIYATYEAGGVKWMVLVLELWPRTGVIDWAKSVVAGHPGHNVIVVTHDYLDGGGGIEQTNGGYGATSPQFLYDQLISKYANIRMVLSGHVGMAGARVDTGVHGNKIYSFLNTFHSETTNPVRLFTVDTKAGTLKTWVYAPHTNQTFSEYSKTLTGVDFVD
jgi:Calcineurin-like phosphoesterase